MNIGSTSSSTLLQQLQQSLFSSADTNGDGDLSLSEFESIGQNVQGSGNTTPSGTTDASSLLTSSALTALVALMQQDQASQTSGTTPTSSTSQTDGSQPPPPPPSDGVSNAQMFADADTNGDGEISATELATAMAANAPAGATTADTTQAASDLMSKLDTNGDGSLSQSEFAAMKPHGGHHHHADAAASTTDSTSTDSTSTDSSGTTYAAADTNKDGVVSAAELAASLGTSLADAGTDISSDALTSLTKLIDQLTSNSSTSSSSTTSIAA